MDDDICIKEEIHIDDCDMGSDNQSTNLEYEEDNGIVKDEQPEENNTLNILEERDNMITVSVGELYSEDERNFIENFNLKEMFADSTQSYSTTKVCIFCKKVFTNEDSFVDHKKNGLCQYFWKQPFSCQVCFLTFESSTKLYKHTRLHQRNMHFCNTGCGKFFRKLEVCRDHEYRDHALDVKSKFKCWMCDIVLPSSNQLIQHKNVQHAYARRHVCSLCRVEFMTILELNTHWRYSPCGSVNFDRQVLNYTGELVLQNFNCNTIITNTNATITTNTTNNNYNGKRKLDPEMENFAFKRIEIPPRKRSEIDASTSLNGIKIKEEPVDEENMDTSNKLTEGLVKSNIKLRIKCEPEDDNQANEYTGSHFNRPSSSTLSVKPFFKAIDINRLRLPSIKKATTEADNKLDRKLIGSTRITANPGGKSINVPKLRLFNEFTDAVNGSGSVVISGDTNKNKSFVANKNNNTNPQNAITIVQVKPSNTNSSQNLVKNENDQLRCINRPLNFVSLPPNTKIVPINFTPQSSKQIPSLKSLIIQRGGAGGGAGSNLPTTSSSVAINTVVNGGVVENKVNASLPSVLIKQTRNRRIISLTNDTMNYIDSLPQSKRIIEDMRRQIRNIQQDKISGEITSVKDIPIEDLPETGQNDLNRSNSEQSSLPPPPSLLDLNLNNATDDKLLARIRKDHPDYRFSWMCPHCPRQYELKYAFRTHLQTTHCISQKRIDNTKMEVRPFKLIDPIEIVKNKTTVESQHQIQSVESSTNDNNTNASMLETQLMILDESTCSSMQSDKSSRLKIINKTKKANNGKFLCSKCRLDFPTMQLLENHQKGVCSKPRKYECTICLKRFSASGTLNCHMSIHTGELPHKCNYCSKRFRTRGQVTVHHRTHTGERPFTCQICSLGFTHRETLISHLSRHIGMKRYKCYGCEKTFSCISGLRTHRDVRPDTCGRVKFSPRAIGPRVRVVKGNVIFEQQPEVNPYLRSENPPSSFD